ncbi:MAG: cytochrome c oxidase subunit 2 [Psychroserpens sp.]|jgi:cytochrome c oxidase subunit 2
MAIVIAIIILVVGSLVFHLVSPWWFTPIASNWQSIDDTISISLWITGFVFVAIGIFLAFTIFKFRYHKNRKSHYEPENKRLEGWLTLVTTIGVIAMLAPGLVVWNKFISVPENSMIVEAVGQQWHWSYRLPGADGILGKTSTNLINERNHFGLDENDIYAQDDLLVKSNELHLPLNQPIKVLLRSKDVLHNFAVPQFRVKMDLVPGVVTYVWFTATREGTFELLCQELCGIAHFTMRGHIIVESKAAYLEWQAKLPTFAQTLERNTENISQGKAIFTSCVACHGALGEGNVQLNAPKIAGLSQWYLNRQLHYFKEKTRGTNANDSYGQQMAAMSSLLTDDQAIKNVSAYISTLMTTEPKTTAIENMSSITSIAKGRVLFKNCSYCHGSAAQGNYAMNAPRLQGQHSWYIKRQLINYQKGTRGAHKKDLYGNQMVMFSKVLHDEQAIDNVVSYIESLEQIK